MKIPFLNIWVTRVDWKSQWLDEWNNWTELYTEKSKLYHENYRFKKWLKMQNEANDILQQQLKNYATSLTYREKTVNGVIV